MMSGPGWLALGMCVVLAAMAGCSSPTAQEGDGDGLSSTSTSSRPQGCGAGASFFGLCPRDRCPDHWHATFAVFVPGGKGADGHDVPTRIDWSSPMAANGQPFYDFGRAPKMSLAVHMHQSGSEAGSDALGPAQLHYEGGKCVNLASSLATVDLHLSGARVAPVADSPLANENPGGPWDAPEHQIRFFLEAELDGSWTWQELDLDAQLAGQLLDGQAILVTVGDYSDQQVEDMQDEVPAPISRRA